MSSNNPLVPTTEDTAKDTIGDLKTDKQEASQTENKKTINNESDKDTALNKLNSLDKSRSYSRTETEDTVKSKNKTRSISSASLDDKYTKEQQQKLIMIRKKFNNWQSKCFKYVCTWRKYNYYISRRRSHTWE